MTKFSDLKLSPKVMKAIADVGYDTPTPIQAEAIPYALEGRDVLGIAQTGTGKTAGFTLPMIHKLARGRARARMPRSLVLAPTRELAAQVAENFELYAKYVKLDMALLIGGVSFKDQDKLIDRGVDVLIATPGRLLDHFERGKLLLTGIEIMVVDEADRMLDMGFIPDIERIFKLTPFTRQTLFFSATMAPEITRITQEFLSNPQRVEVARQATTSENIDQKVCCFTASHRKAEAKEKRTLLRKIITDEGERLTNGIIFCNRKIDVDIVLKSLKKHGYSAGAIHGDLDQKYRMQVLDGFKNNEIQLLVASDVAARGLDIPNVSHVFNYDVPIHSEDYVHRIGRTGRAGRSGWAFMLCLPHEQKNLDKIEELVKHPIPRLEAPELPKPARKEPRKAKEQPKEQSPVGQEPAAEKPHASDRPKATPKSAPKSTTKPAPKRGNDNRVRGLGQHVPAFLMRNIRGENPDPIPQSEGLAPDTQD
ncbi:DEAD/DEAH box helicase [Amylibacter marinus]|uniref:DEAD/DEAH box helicase n=1 Tax=Amylibacter marinus TaxID=1475483 RepID=A0ABQ5VUB4_9RHOB|nr:DEAD/DEAH box helicase [Amylibacter marinus]GLQ34761.1 DEAD/DEAH box helicase [Amylibacter marinus]